ncbi:MAG: hypothetical protein R3C69_06825 [Geminicoccaceae bacterium]
MLTQQLHLKSLIVIAEEHGLAPISTLGDIVCRISGTIARETQLWQQFSADQRPQESRGLGFPKLIIHANRRSGPKVTGTENMHHIYGADLLGFGYWYINHDMRSIHPLSG